MRKIISKFIYIYCVDEVNDMLPIRENLDYIFLTQVLVYLL
jgi:hypothetical protein